jgi:hypothetical protein
VSIDISSEFTDTGLVSQVQFDYLSRGRLSGAPLAAAPMELQHAENETTSMGRLLPVCFFAAW